MFYITGDIHGSLANLKALFNKLKKYLTNEDTLIFLGDYIDRGIFAFEVIEYLISLSKKYNTIFIKGNHEDMLLKYKGGDDLNNFIANGGSVTLRSYKKNTGGSGIPWQHQSFYNNLQLYYKSDDFIAVHAGLNPTINNIEEQQEEDLIWIREKFYRSERRWDKTIIFGHTPCSILHGKLKEVYINDETNIIGLDTGACYGGLLTCLRWPDRMIFQG